MEERNFSDIDPNFKQKTDVASSLKYHVAEKGPIMLEGLPFVNEDGRYSRLPLATAKLMHRPAEGPAMQTTGGLVRFRTNSPVIGVRVRVAEYYTSPSLSKRLSAGFDLYRGNAPEMRFLGARHIENAVTEYELSWEIATNSMADYSIYLPTFCSFFEIKIGIAGDAVLEAPTPRRHEKGVAFYGSSITNCGAAGRPGMLYPAIIGRMLDIETINIGFAGRCLGDLCVADAIAKLDLSTFVLEYDHNAPSPEFLRQTHEPFFRHFRQLRPELPVLLISKTDGNFSSEVIQERRAIIARTWLNAHESGDRHVEFLDGETIFAGEIREDCTSDGCHQNDQGERLMAERIADRLKRMITK